MADTKEIYERCYSALVKELNTTLVTEGKKQECIDSFCNFIKTQVARYEGGIDMSEYLGYVLKKLRRFEGLNILGRGNPVLHGDDENLITVLEVLRNKEAATSNEQTEMDNATTKPLTKGHKQQSSFRSIIQYQDPDALLERLHQLIDSKNRHCADVGAVILNAKHIHGYLSRFPTKAEFECEFHLTGTWKATSNYFDANKNKCLAKASDIVIF